MADIGILPYEGNVFSVSDGADPIIPSSGNQEETEEGGKHDTCTVYRFRRGLVIAVVVFLFIVAALTVALATAPTHSSGTAQPHGVEQTSTARPTRTPVDGVWSAWSNWDECSVTCGGGLQVRGRECNNPVPRNGGQDCTGDAQEDRRCGTNPCPVNGRWSAWSNWRMCSVTCGGGLQVRERECSNPVPLNGGQSCTGDAQESRQCGTNPCQVDGGWSAWSNREVCSATCGGGLQVRERECNNPVPRNGGKDCTGDAEEYGQCAMNPCPVDGRWSAWSDWGVCSVTCGGGMQVRERECINPAPRHGGKACTGDAQEYRQCGTNPCPVNGGWSAWSNWGACSVSCGGGMQVRERKCTNPAPRNGGQVCAGDAYGNRQCGTNSCPVSDCQDIYDNGRTNSGLYDINPTWSHDPIQVYCNMSDGGGWTVIQRHYRRPSRQDFNQNWLAYRNGFGEPSDEFWIGNEKIFFLTNSSEYELRIDMVQRGFNRQFYAEYKLFRITAESDNYRLSELGTFSGTTGYDALRAPDNPDGKSLDMYFSTPDRENDRYSGYAYCNSTGSCAACNRGGWWFNNCHHFNPNYGIGIPDCDDDCVGSWWNLPGGRYLIYTEMKIRPRVPNQ